jgi:hypothetical protein
MPEPRQATRYAQIIERIFLRGHSAGDTQLKFTRVEIQEAAEALGITLPKNLGDVIYSFRYRTPLPESIRRTAPEDREWAIVGAGKGRYRFECVPFTNIEPRPTLAETKVPDATPGIIEMYALSDEQALLAKLRYNRLIDVFTGLACYSLQNHLRTTVPGLGQVETDEVYVGLDRRGAHFVLPVQAKGGSDKLSTVQIGQDFALCSHLFPDLIALPMAAQFLDDDLIALFAFELQDGHPAIASERHYRLVGPGDVDDEELRAYKTRPLD